MSVGLLASSATLVSDAANQVDKAPRAESLDRVVFVTQRSHNDVDLAVTSARAHLSELATTPIDFQFIRETSAEPLLDQLKQLNPQVIFCFGQATCELICNRTSGVTIIASLLTSAELEQLKEKYPDARLAGVAQNQPLARQLALAELLEPSRLLVLLGGHSVANQTQILQWGQMTGIPVELVQTRPDRPVQLLLARTARPNDVLLALADRSVFNGANLGDLLRISYREQVHVIGYSPAFVRAGALVALYSTPPSLGEQAALLAFQIFAEPGSQGHTTVYPDQFEVAVNPHMANLTEFQSLDRQWLKEQISDKEARAMNATKSTLTEARDRQ